MAPKLDRIRNTHVDYVASILGTNVVYFGRTEY